MEEKSQQVEGQQEGCQMLGSMPEVMFEVIALGFEHVVVFVLHFPAGSSGLHDGLDGGADDLMRCDPGIPIGDFSRGFAAGCSTRTSSPSERLPRLVREPG